ncbi:MAG: HU-CCDC81 and SPOR domain-containing protein [Flavobacteriales bacterium]|nr:HU-CCDC81 and SPOR domain-containing protein [Flavobacteriales bacterium]MCB9193437.1 HU-CCDC81 and SPOR domain-containing protein [Flavobacteriales bacterium]
MKLEREIHELLYGHDCVIVPGFGGFLTHYRPARIDEVHQVVHPPSKEVSFNRNLVRNDGLLADQVARREGIGFDEAGMRIAYEVTDRMQRLERQGRLEMPRIGTFFMDDSSNLQFEPDRRVNFLRDAFGLRPVPASPLQRPAVRPIVRPAVRAMEQATSGPRSSAPISRNWIWAAAGAVLLLALGTTYWAVSSSGKAKAVWSGIELFGPMEQEEYRPRTAEFDMSGTLPDLHWMPADDLRGVRELPVTGQEGMLFPVDLGPEVAAPESTAVAVPTAHDKYHVIGGCFSIRENADRFIAELVANGFPAHLVDEYKGLYRVAFGSYPQKAAALEALQAVRREHAPEAWLLVR